MALAIADAAKAGQWERVRDLTEELKALRVPLDGERLNVQGERNMIDARSQAIAVKAAGRNKLLKAISHDHRWGSATRYCRQRLGISPGSLTGYMQGTTPVPRRIVDMVQRDFPGLDWTWKKIAE